MNAEEIGRAVQEGWIRVREGDLTRREIQLTSEDLVWSNQYLQVFNDHVRFPEPPGFPAIQEGRYLRLTYAEGTGDGVVIVAVAEEDQILLVRQFRHAPRLWMEELPRGFAKVDEQNRLTAKRELLQETGYRLDMDQMYPLGRVIPDSGKLHDAPYLIVARAHAEQYRSPERTEPIVNLRKYAFSVLKLKCQRGEILDMFTLAAVVRAEPCFRNDRFSPDKEFLRSADRIKGSLTDLRYDDQC